MQCLFFLNGCSGNIDDAAKRIERYYQIKTSSPEFFWNRNPESKCLQRVFKVQQMASLPITPKNYFVFIQRSIDSNSKNFHFDDVFKTFMMIAGKLTHSRFCFLNQLLEIQVFIFSCVTVSIVIS